jgi:hypothetical protein
MSNREADPGLSLKPGARLVREWHGRIHTVTVTEDRSRKLPIRSLLPIGLVLASSDLCAQPRRVRVTQATLAKSSKASRSPTRKMRCAIYTRKSSEEGLEQAFNSMPVP